jgi:hypothetical protein
MKRNTKLTIAIILLLCCIPTSRIVYVYASGSCTSLTCTLSDAFNLTDTIKVTLGVLQNLSDSFHLTDSVPIIKLGIPPLKLSDEFHLTDSSFNIQISNNGNPCSNLYITQTNCVNPNSVNNGLSISTGTVGMLTTLIVVPFALIFLILWIARVKIGVTEFNVLLGFIVFIYLGLIYIKVFPPWAIIIPILFGSAILASVVDKFLSGGKSQIS